MGYRPNQPRPSAPTPAGGHDRVRQGIYVLVGLLSAAWVIGVMFGLVDHDVAPLVAGVIGALVAYNASRLAPLELPDPRETARALTRARIRRELDADRDRVAWILKTNRLEAELGMPLSDYSEETAAIGARVKVRDGELEALQAQEDAEREAPARAAQPPPPPPGRGAVAPREAFPADARFLFGYPVDREAGVVVVGGNDRGRVQYWLDRRGYQLRAVREHNLFTGRPGPPCRHCGLGPHRYEGTHRYDDGASGFDDHGRRIPDQSALALLKKGALTLDEVRSIEAQWRNHTAEPVRILQGGMVARHICTTVDCNGKDSPHCPMSKPCTCGKPGRGWPDCPQHPGLSPL